MYISTLELSHAFLRGLNSIKRYLFMTVLGIIAIFWTVCALEILVRDQMSSQVQEHPIASAEPLQGK